MKEIKLSGIYMIQSISKPERIYVGSAMDIDRRWQEHRRALRREKHRSPTLQRHFNKYGEADLAFEVIESGVYADKNHLLSREQGWFIPYAYQNTELPYFNTVFIAGSIRGFKFTAEQNKRNSERQRGNIPWNKGMIYPLEGREKFSHPGSKYWLGKHPSEETRKKQSIKKLGKPSWNKDKIVDELWGNKKPILQYSKDMVFIRGWNSAADAARGLSILPNHIYNVLRGDRKTANGFIWKYKMI